LAECHSVEMTKFRWHSLSVDDNHSIIFSTGKYIKYMQAKTFCTGSSGYP
jgi:hypothetical protein